MSVKNRIGLIGSGLMGKPMGMNWLKKGYQLTVLPHKNLVNITELQKAGATVAQSPMELASFTDLIILMLPTSREVEAAIESLIKFLTPKHIVIDMSTSEPQSTREIFEKFKAKNLKFFDAPVTGGVKGAVEGSLTLFVGGPRELFLESKDVLNAVSKIQTHFGEAGQGHVAKIINNFVCIGNLAVFSEALPLAMRMGLNPRDIFQTLTSGTAASRMLDLYGVQILNGDFAPRFKLSHAYKDLKLAEDLLKDIKAKLPVLEGVVEDFKKAMDQNLGDENVSAVIKTIEDQMSARFRSN